MIFLTFSIYPYFCSLILIVMIFQHLPLWCLICYYFQNDALMTKCNLRDQPFDVLIKIELRTWRQWIEPPRLLNVRSRGGRGSPRITKGRQQKITIILKISQQKRSFKADTIYFGSLKLSTSFIFWTLSSSCVIVNVVISSEIDLKTNMVLFARKDSHTEGFWAN